MPTDMVRKPQDKPVMECRDMKVGALSGRLGERLHSERS